MNDVMQAVGVFFSYAVLAVFAQNAVFTRASACPASSSWWATSAPAAGGSLCCSVSRRCWWLRWRSMRAASSPPQSNPAQLRPLVYLPAWRW